MAYQVVFEYTSKAGGYNGIRTRTDFKDRAEYLEWLKGFDLTLQTPIAEGVTDEEGLKLVCETKEVCRVKAAIQDSFFGDELNLEYLLSLKLPTAYFAISHDRVFLDRPNFRFSRPKFPHKDFSHGVKECLFKLAEDCSDPDSGQMDLEDFNHHLKTTLLTLVVTNHIS